MLKDTSGTIVSQPNFRKVLGGESKWVCPTFYKEVIQPKESAKPKPKDEPRKEAKKEEPVKPKP